jgi:hypothetical protein
LRRGPVERVNQSRRVQLTFPDLTPTSPAALDFVVALSVADFWHRFVGDE